MGYYLIQQPGTGLSLVERALMKYTQTYPEDPINVKIQVDMPGLIVTVTGKSGSIKYPSQPGSLKQGDGS